MSTTCVTRTGSVGVTADVWTALTAEGTVTTPGQAKVPSDKTKIKSIVVGIGDKAPTAGIHAHSYLLKLDGSGMADGEQIFNLGSTTVNIVTKGPSGEPTGAARYDVDVNVKPNGPINFYVCSTAGLIGGEPYVGVTLVLQ